VNLDAIESNAKKRSGESMVETIALTASRRIRRQNLFVAFNQVEKLRNDSLTPRIHQQKEPEDLEIELRH
jgi:hypothetical protein